jgi:3-methyladenine DNA glycosylase AlkD
MSPITERNAKTAPTGSDFRQKRIPTQIVSEIKTEIMREAEPEFAERLTQYFKESIKTHGLRAPQQKEIARKYYHRVKKDLPIAIEVTQELMETQILDEASVGIMMLRRMNRHLTPAHFDTVDSWVDLLTNWANTDGLSAWIIADIVKKDPSLTDRLLVAWKDDMLDQVFKIADRLMTDGDDMVRKGVGWLLKEASKEHPQEIRDHLLKWRGEASALVLRYASENLPKEMRVLKTK